MRMKQEDRADRFAADFREKYSGGGQRD